MAVAECTRVPRDPVGRPRGYRTPDLESFRQWVAAMCRDGTFPGVACMPEEDQHAAPFVEAALLGTWAFGGRSEAPMDVSRHPAAAHFVGCRL